MVYYGDITKLKGYELPIVDIITGGSPCQDLSQAGRRAGLAGERSGLFMEQIRIIKEMRENDRVQNKRTNETARCRYMVWENVYGALSSPGKENAGEDFRAVLEETAQVADPNAVIPRPANGRWSNAGCVMADRWSVAWRVHDAQFWGTAQRRRRVSLVADFGGQSAPEILFEREGSSRNPEESGSEEQTVTGGAQNSSNEASEPLTVTASKASYFTRACQDDLAQTLVATDYKDPQIVAYAIENHPADSRVKLGGDTVQTLTSRMGTGGGNTPMVLQSEPDNREYIVRRLTPLECERLQGLPDGWTDIGDWVDGKGKVHKGESDAPRYKALGNSIALPFWEWMAKRMVKYLDNKPTMASLFDGIGGFPLVYSRAGCTPVWASEIEDFPVAVTKLRFGEERENG